MNQLRHLNILTFYGAVTTNTAQPCIVMEKCQCSVYDQLKKYGSLANSSQQARLNLQTRIRYGLDAAKGLVFLHRRLIIHRDLKTSNLLISNDRNKTIKVCDFAISREMGGSNSVTEQSLPTADASNLGTPGWGSPEQILGDQVTFKSDVYSFAMILWELLHATVPFRDELFGTGMSPSLQKLRLMDITIKQLRPPIEQEKQAWFGASHEVWALYTELMTQCWSQDPAGRPDFEEVQERIDSMLKIVKAESSQ